MKTYYEQNRDKTIGRSTENKDFAKVLGLALVTDREIVYGYNGKRYFKGDEPPPSPRLKNYSIPDLFFWLRGYDEGHPEAKKGQAVVDLLNSQDLYTIAVTTRIVSEDNELFAPTIAAIKDTVGFTDAEIADALSYAETGADPDPAA